MEKELYAIITPDPNGLAKSLVLRLEDMAYTLESNFDTKDLNFNLKVVQRTKKWFEKLELID